MNIFKNMRPDGGPPIGAPSWLPGNPAGPKDWRADWAAKEEGEKKAIEGKFYSDGATYGPFLDGREVSTGYIAGPDSYINDNMQGCRITNPAAAVTVQDGQIIKSEPT